MLCVLLVSVSRDQAIFVPQPSNKPLTEINYKELNSDLRSNKRREFDEKLSQKEADAARMKELQELEQKVGGSLCHGFSLLGGRFA